MNRLAMGLLTKLSGSLRFQKWLERNVALFQYLRGIGSGSSIGESGEQAVLDMLRRKAGAGEPPCIFDVGANKGQFLGLIERCLTGVRFQVHAFEPGRAAFDVLRDDFANRADVILNNSGLGREPGTFELFYDSPGSVLASLSKRDLAHFGIEFGYSEKVEIGTLDEYCAQKRISRIDLLKLDVEGHELDVLRGGVRMFDERRVGMVSFEFGGCNIDSRTFLRDFHHFFKNHGMKALHRIAPSGCLVPIEHYQEAEEQFRTTNFLVLPDWD